MTIPDRIARIEALDVPARLPGAEPAQPLASVVRDRAAIDVLGNNSYRIHLERKHNKFIKLEPELEAAVHRRR